MPRTFTITLDEAKELLAALENVLLFADVARTDDRLHVNEVRANNLRIVKARLEQQIEERGA